MSRKRIVTYSIVFVLLVGFGTLWHYWQRSTTTEPKTQKPHSAKVQVAKVRKILLPKYVETVGILRAKQITNISSDIADKVVAVLYQPGGYVTKGTPLIQLDDRTYRANLQSDEAAYALAKVNYQRYLSLAKLGAQAKQTLDQARASYLQAKAKVSADQTLLSKTTIRAPFSGYIGSKTVSIGDYVQPGQVLTVLVNRKLLQVNYSFPEKYLPELKLNQKVTITMSGDAKAEQHRFTGKVTYVAPQIDEATHSIKLQADIPNKNNELTPGLFVKVRQETGVAKNTLVIPEESLLPTITGNEVYIVRNGKAYAVPIKIGLTFKNKIQVLSGLKQNDAVITVGQQQLKDGTPVKEVASS